MNGEQKQNFDLNNNEDVTNYFYLYKYSNWQLKKVN